jgi:hypothetical protein
MPNDDLIRPLLGPLETEAEVADAAERLFALAMSEVNAQRAVVTAASMVLAMQAEASDPEGLERRIKLFSNAVRGCFEAISAEGQA